MFAQKNSGDGNAEERVQEVEGAGANGPNTAYQREPDHCGGQAGDEDLIG